MKRSGWHIRGGSTSGINAGDSGAYCGLYGAVSPPPVPMKILYAAVRWCRTCLASATPGRATGVWRESVPKVDKISGRATPCHRSKHAGGWRSGFGAAIDLCPQAVRKCWSLPFGAPDFMASICSQAWRTRCLLTPAAIMASRYRGASWQEHRANRRQAR